MEPLQHDLESVQTPPGIEPQTRAASRLGISVFTVKRWIDSGKLRGLRLTPQGPRYAVTADVDRLVKDRTPEGKK